MIIEELKKIDSVIVVFFYCKYSDDQKNSLTAALRSILAQLVQQNEELLFFVYEKVCCSTSSTIGTANSITVQCASSSEVTLESPALKELVGTCLKSCTNVFIVFDGLDECAAGEEKRITAWLLKTVQDNNKDSTNSLRGLLISQRDAALERLLTSAPVISLETREHQKDIEAYCRGWSPRIAAKFDIETASANHIATSVAEQADGESTNLQSVFS